MDRCVAACKNLRVLLPRNLSYTQDSLLDYFSISADYVSKRKFDKSIKKSELSGKLYKMSESVSDPTDLSNSGGLSAGSRDVLCPNVVYQRQISDSQESEEGIYVNMSDDLDSPEDSLGESSTVNLSADSMFSPDEGNGDLDVSSEGHPVSLKDAVKKIALEPPLSTELKIEINDEPLSLQKNDSKQSIYDMLSDSPVFEDSEFNFNKAELRKSSSLKTNKTPPGTPRRKKAVRFADAMGLDLEDVRHILNMEVPPKIPASAMKDLRVGVEADRATVGTRFLTPRFNQPGAEGNFTQRVIAEKVCLENAVITGMTITGVVRVANVGFHKTVRIRFSTNKWISFHDIAASYVMNSCDGATDRFSFSIVAPMDVGVGSTLEFAVQYSVGDQVYWDNNRGANYIFECFARTIPTESDSYWMHFL